MVGGLGGAVYHFKTQTPAVQESQEMSQSENMTGMPGENQELPESIINQFTGEEMTLEGPYAEIAGQYLLDVPGGTELNGIFQLDIDSQGKVNLQAYDRANGSYVNTKGTIVGKAEATGTLQISLDEGGTAAYAWQDGALANGSGEVFNRIQDWETTYQSQSEVDLNQRAGF